MICNKLAFELEYECNGANCCRDLFFPNSRVILDKEKKAIKEWS